MVYSGVNPPANKIRAGGEYQSQELKIETATNCYPGRFVEKGTNDDDIQVSSGISAPLGVLSYEDTNPAYRPDTITSLYAAGAMAQVIKGGPYIHSPLGLALGTVAVKNDYLLNWSAGQVVPALKLDGRFALKIPFSKNTSETSTGVRIPAGAVVTDVGLDVVDAVASSTVDVGTLSTDSGDADGFLDGESGAVAGKIVHNTADATAANITVGELLEEVELKDANSVYFGVPTGYQVPTGGKIISYLTSDHDVSGNILVFLKGPVVVGQVEKSVSAASAAANILFKLQM